MKMLSAVEMILDTKPNWRLYYAEGEKTADVTSFRELTASRDEIEQWAGGASLGCALFVEGHDDDAVVGEFLFRQLGGMPYKRGIHILRGLGGEGKERAVHSAAYVAGIARRLNQDIPFLVVLDGDASNWASSQTEVDSTNLFVLSKREIEAYLLDAKAIAKVCNVADKEVAEQMERAKGGDKARLEYIVGKFGVRPTAQVKQLIARHLDVVPEDFVKMLDVIQRIQ